MAGYVASMSHRVLLVNGGGRGIGTATCRLAGTRGYRVAVKYRRDAGGAQRSCQASRTPGLRGSTASRRHNRTKSNASSPRPRRVSGVSLSTSTCTARCCARRQPRRRSRGFGRGLHDLSLMTTPALVVTGDSDFNPMFSERRDWRADAYRLSPGLKSLLTLNGARHFRGGISGYDAKEASDENPRSSPKAQRITWVYIRTRCIPTIPLGTWWRRSLLILQIRWAASWLANRGHHGRSGEGATQTSGERGTTCREDRDRPS